VRQVAWAAVAVGAAGLMSPLHSAEPGLSSGVFFWGQDAMGMGHGVTFPSEIVDLVATDNVFYCLSRDGNVAQVAGGGPYQEFQVPPEATNVVAISAGAYHMMALRADGRVIAWGAPGFVPRDLILAVPPDLTNAVAIAAGYDHCLALRSDGRIAAWGVNDRGQLNVPEGLSNVVASASWPEQKASAQLTVRPMAPWFLESPQDLSARPGEPVELRCLARGTEPISYQWLRDGQLLEGASQPSLSFPSLTLQQGGFYTVIARNEVGTSPEAPAYLQVLASGQFLAPQVQVDGSFRFQLSVDPGQFYRVQTSPDLVNWEDWLGFVSTDGNLELEDPAPTADNTRFYRLISP
jgi:hypothetical protein